MKTGISHNQAFAQKHRHKSLVTVAVTYLAVSPHNVWVPWLALNH